MAGIPGCRGSIYKRGRIFWVKWSSLATGKVYRESTRASERRAAEVRAKRLIRNQDLREAGFEVSDADASLGELRERWGAYLLNSRGRTADHVKRSTSLVEDFLDAVGLADAPPTLLQRELAERWLYERRDALGWSARTFNAYRGYLVAFGRWLWERERVLSQNPMAGLETVRGAKRRKRRALEDGVGDARLVAGEGRRLVEVAPWPWNVLWLTVLSTGLRKSEADRLEWRDVGLRKLALVVRWEASKAKREDVLPISLEVAEALRGLLEVQRLGLLEHPDQIALIRQLAASGLKTDAIARELRRKGVERASGGRWWWQHVAAVLEAEPREVHPEQPVFEGMPRRRLDRGLYRHLEAARIPRQTQEGVVDFQALRKTYGTQLRRRGVHPVVIQRLLRHTDPRLTTVTYQSFDLTDLRPALPGFERREA